MVINMKKVKNKHKHLTASQRDAILEGIVSSLSATEIGKIIGKDRSCVSKEVKKHRVIEIATRFKNGKTTMCANIKECPIQNTKECTRNCSNFAFKVCRRLEKFPYVCNGCEKLKGKGCQINTHKYYYVPSTATHNYNKNLSESRRGLHISAYDFKVLEELLEDGVMNRKNSIYQVYTANSEVIPVTEQTVYNYVNCGYLTTKRVSMPLAARLKPPKKRYKETKMEQEWVDERTYNDFKNYIKNTSNDLFVLEMDTVIGKRDEDGCFLTLINPATQLFLAFKLKKKNAFHVRTKMYQVLRILHDNIGYKDIVILTDRGPEFHEPDRLEVHDVTGEVLCKVFYCDPYNSSQKPHIENVHTMLRRMVPKGTSLEDYTQNDCNFFMSNINSYARKNLDGSTPFETFANNFGATTLHRLKIKKIKQNDVSLKVLK